MMIAACDVHPMECNSVNSQCHVFTHHQQCLSLACNACRHLQCHTIGQLLLHFANENPSHQRLIVQHIWKVRTIHMQLPCCINVPACKQLACKQSQDITKVFKDPKIINNRLSTYIHVKLSFQAETRNKI